MSEAKLPASQAVLLKIVVFGGVLAVVLAIVAAIAGWFVAALPGVWGGLLGAFVSGVFMSLTAAAIAVANRYIQSVLYVQIFFGAVLGTMLLKIVFFLVLAFILRDADWLHSVVFFVTVIAGVCASLILDLTVIFKNKLAAVSDTQLR